MAPSVLTSAFRLEITQSWPGGWTPRTRLRLTTVAVAAVPWPDDTGITPIPPSKRTRRSSACAENAASESAAAITVTFISKTSSRCGVGLHRENTCIAAVFREGDYPVVLCTALHYLPSGREHESNSFARDCGRAFRGLVKHAGSGRRHADRAWQPQDHYLRRGQRRPALRRVES